MDEDQPSKDDDRFEVSQQELLPCTVEAEPVAGKVRLPPEVLAGLDLGPEIIHPEREDGLEEVQNENAEELSAASMKA